MKRCCASGCGGRSRGPIRLAPRRQRCHLVAGTPAHDADDRREVSLGRPASTASGVPSSRTDDRIELFAPGALGTCWYGRYHYLEPWVGCEHDCDYCYARYRSLVRRSLAEHATEFARAQPMLPPDALLRAIRERLAVGDIKVLKLSRYTDLFTPTMVANGLARAVLQAIVDSPAERAIITTKGVPDAATLELMVRHAAKVSYNFVAKPAGAITLEGNVAPVAERIAAAAWLSKHNVLTTVHLDPIVPGVEDDPALLRPFFATLQQAGLQRVMFSLLLLTPEMIDEIRRRRGTAVTDALLANFAVDEARQYLPRQGETVYIAARPEIKQRCVTTIANILREMGFQFVLCSLKNVGTEVSVDRTTCPRCDGTFYA